MFRHTAVLSGTEERCSGIVCHLFINFKKACDLFRREVFYNILIEFNVLMEIG
jgi:hypothetical protein